MNAAMPKQEVLHALEEIVVIGESQIALLKHLAWASPKKRSRICLSGHQDGIQEMVIALRKDSYVRPHRHLPHKSESYHLIEGELEVRIFESNGVVKEKIKLDKFSPLYRMKGGWYHQPIALTSHAIYHECLTGPFDHEIDVQYAAWAEAEKV